MYYPFKKTLQEMEFSDVEEFCKLGVSENLFLDYKEEIRGDKLSKSIASFANTKGGILLIGVSEDKTTKLPSRWDGVTDTGTLSETINSVIANVVPFPTCRFAVIPHKIKGKSFALIIVEEGGRAPYFTIHKPIVYVRTGDISTPISESNRADLLALTERGDIANAKVKASLRLADEIFNERYQRAKDTAKSNQPHVEPRNTTISPMLLPTVDIDFEALNGYAFPVIISSIIPLNPNELVDVKDLYDQQLSFRYEKGDISIPPRGVMLDPVRYGIVTKNDFAFNIARGKFRYIYLNKYGLIQYRTELIASDDDVKVLNMFNAVYSVLNTIRYASTFYSHFNYTGSLKLIVQLENLDKDLYLLGSRDFMADERIMEIDLTSYDWSLELSTHDIKSEKLEEILVKLFTDIYLDLGFKDIPSDVRKILDEFKL